PIDPVTRFLAGFNKRHPGLFIILPLSWFNFPRNVLRIPRSVLRNPPSHRHSAVIAFRWYAVVDSPRRPEHLDAGEGRFPRPGCRRLVSKEITERDTSRCFRHIVTGF